MLLFILSLFLLSVAQADPQTIIIVGCDGMGEMYIENATSLLPNMGYLMRHGTYSNVTRTHMPSVSAPNWATIITGMPPEKSGVYDNDWTPNSASPPNITVFEMPPANGVGKIPEPMWTSIKNQNPNMTTGVYNSWPWINYLAQQDVDYHVQSKIENDVYIMGKVIETVLLHNQTNLIFIHLNEVDASGHETYWGSPAYYDAVKAIDIFLGKLLKLLDWDRTTMLVTADHGGMGSSHGYFNEVTMYVPSIFYGHKICQGKYLTEYIDNTYFAPTMMHAIGLTPGPYMEGMVLDDVFC